MDVNNTLVKHIRNNICRFIGKEIVGKFGVPKLLIIDNGSKLVANATKVYLAKKGIKNCEDTVPPSI